MTAIPEAPAYPNLSQGFLLDEDNALRRHLMGLTVSDDAADPRKVGVWFSHPDNEVREQRYPYIVISLIDVTEASNRVHSGTYEPVSVPLDWLGGFGNVVLGTDSYGVVGAYNALGRWSDVWDDRWGRPLRFEGPSPIPVQIDYQVRAFSRHPRHSRELIAGLLGRRIPYRYGVLDMRDIDGSIRRTQLMDIAHGESVEDQKRLFVEVFTIRVDSFMPYSMDDLIAYEDQFVSDVFLDVYDGVDYGPGDKPMTSDHTRGWETQGPDNYERETSGWAPYDRPAHLTLPQHQQPEESPNDN